MKSSCTALDIDALIADFRVEAKQAVADPGGSLGQLFSPKCLWHPFLCLSKRKERLKII